MAFFPTCISLLSVISVALIDASIVTRHFEQVWEEADTDNFFDITPDLYNETFGASKATTISTEFENLSPANMTAVRRSKRYKLWFNFILTRLYDGFSNTHYLNRQPNIVLHLKRLERLIRPSLCLKTHTTRGLALAADLNMVVRNRLLCDNFAIEHSPKFNNEITEFYFIMEITDLFSANFTIVEMRSGYKVGVCRHTFFAAFRYYEHMTVYDFHGVEEFLVIYCGNVKNVHFTTTGRVVLLFRVFPNDLLFIRMQYSIIDNDFGSKMHEQTHTFQIEQYLPDQLRYKAELRGNPSQFSAFPMGTWQFYERIDVWWEVRAPVINRVGYVIAGGICSTDTYLEMYDRPYDLTASSPAQDAHTCQDILENTLRYNEGNPVQHMARFSVLTILYSNKPNTYFQVNKTVNLFISIILTMPEITCAEDHYTPSNCQTEKVKIQGTEEHEIRIDTLSMSDTSFYSLEVSTSPGSNLKLRVASFDIDNDHSRLCDSGGIYLIAIRDQEANTTVSNTNPFYAQMPQQQPVAVYCTISGIWLLETYSHVAKGLNFGRSLRLVVQRFSLGFRLKLVGSVTRGDCPGVFNIDYNTARSNDMQAVYTVSPKSKCLRVQGLSGDVSDFHHFQNTLPEYDVNLLLTIEAPGTTLSEDHLVSRINLDAYDAYTRLWYPGPIPRECVLMVTNQPVAFTKAWPFVIFSRLRADGISSIAKRKLQFLIQPYYARATTSWCRGRRYNTYLLDITLETKDKRICSTSFHDNPLSLGPGAADMYKLHDILQNDWCRSYRAQLLGNICYTPLFDDKCGSITARLNKEGVYSFILDPTQTFNFTAISHLWKFEIRVVARDSAIGTIRYYPVILVSYPLQWEVGNKEPGPNTTNHSGFLVHLPGRSLERRYSREGRLRDVTYEYKPSVAGIITVHTQDLYTPAVITIITNISIEDYDLVIAYYTVHKPTQQQIEVLCDNVLNTMCLDNTIYTLHIPESSPPSWEQAESHCQREQGHLLSINSEWEWKAILVWIYKLRNLLFEATDDKNPENATWGNYSRLTMGDRLEQTKPRSARQHDREYLSINSGEWPLGTSDEYYRIVHHFVLVGMLWIGLEGLNQVRDV